MSRALPRVVLVMVSLSLRSCTLTRTSVPLEMLCWDLRATVSRKEGLLVLCDKTFLTSHSDRILPHLHYLRVGVQPPLPVAGVPEEDEEPG